MSATSQLLRHFTETQPCSCSDTHRFVRFDFVLQFLYPFSIHFYIVLFSVSMSRYMNERCVAGGIINEATICLRPILRMAIFPHKARVVFPHGRGSISEKIEDYLRQITPKSRRISRETDHSDGRWPGNSTSSEGRTQKTEGR